MSVFGNMKCYETRCVRIENGAVVFVDVDTLLEFEMVLL